MILVLTNADTEILGLRVVAESLPDAFPPVRAANPSTLSKLPDLDGVEVVLVRLLGGRRAFEGFDNLVVACARRSIPLLCLGGEAVPDGEMMALSTVPGGVVTQALEYFVQGGTENLGEVLKFVADTVLLGGYGFAPPVVVPSVGVFGERSFDPSRPSVGVVFYRAHVLTGNTTFVEDLCEAIESKGANAIPVFCYSLRDGDPKRESAVAAILRERKVSCVITTVLAAGSFAPGIDVAAGIAAEGWGERVLGSLGVPIVQAIAATGSTSAWAGSPAGLAPLDVAWGIALPELDGRIIAVPFSFKEVVDDGEDLGAAVSAYRTVPDRVSRIAGLAVRFASLRRKPPAERRVAIVLSAYPTRRSRLGNAVGLDTPVSLIDLLHELRGAGYRIDRIPASGDELMAELADGLAYDSERLSSEQAVVAVGSMAASRYESWFESLPRPVREEMEEAWGKAPGSVHLAEGESGDRLLFSGLDLGGVLIAIQPPRGFGANPIAIYHSPVLPPTHHYLAF
ncbi:MAG: cobaltochelatase subunit CobN, partial [Acidimicrobiales bacterium]